MFTPKGISLQLLTKGSCTMYNVNKSIAEIVCIQFLVDKLDTVSLCKCFEGEIFTVCYKRYMYNVNTSFTEIVYISLYIHLHSFFLHYLHKCREIAE